MNVPDLNEKNVAEALYLRPLPWMVVISHTPQPRDGEPFAKAHLRDANGTSFLEVPEYRRPDLDLVCTIVNAYYQDRLRRQYMISDLERIIDDRIRASGGWKQ